MGIPTLISTATASGAANVSITSGIDSTYNEYMFVCTDVSPSADAKSFYGLFSTDGGSSYGLTKTSSMFQALNEEDDSSAELVYNSDADLDQSSDPITFTSSSGSGADESSVMIFHLFNPSNTTYIKHFYFTCNTYASNNLSRVVYGAGYINTTSAVNAVKFYFQTESNIDGVFQMYGIA